MEYYNGGGGKYSGYAEATISKDSPYPLLHTAQTKSGQKKGQEDNPLCIHQLWKWYASVTSPPFPLNKLSSEVWMCPHTSLMFSSVLSGGPL